MNTLLNPLFWFSAIYFVFIIFVSFFIPGFVIIQKLAMPKFVRFVTATILGMVLWAWQGFIFGFLQIRFLTYFYIFIFVGVWLWQNRKFRIRKISFKPKIDTIASLLLLSGMVVQLIPVIGFGLQYQRGMYLCCGNREDFVYHVALTRSLTASIPPVEPGMVGHIVVNYHYWANLVLAELIRIYNIPIFPLHFQFIPVFISLFFGLAIIAFTKSLFESKSFTRWLLFFFYFGGDGIYALLLLLKKNIFLMTKVSSLEDGSTFLLNPPRAFAMVIFLVGLTLFVYWIKKKDIKWGIAAIFLLASTIGFKVYIGLFGALGIVGIILWFIYKKQKQNILLSLLFFPIAAIIYLSDNANSGGIFWAPFLLANNFIVQPTFGLQRFELARLIYLEHHNIPRLFIYESLATLLFIVAICGTKIIAFFQSIKSFLSIGKELFIFLGFGLLGSLFVGLFFLQQSGGANIFNFIVSFWLLLSIFSALAMTYWQKKLSKLLYIFLSVVIILLTIPRVALNTYLNTMQYIKGGYLYITPDHLHAFTYINTITPKNSLFLIDPGIGFDRSTPFIYAFIQRPMYISGENILTSHQINVQNRVKLYQDLFKTSNIKVLTKELTQTNADYIYLWQRKEMNATESANFITPVFSDGDITILKINKEKESEIFQQLFPKNNTSKNL